MLQNPSILQHYVFFISIVSVNTKMVSNLESLGQHVYHRQYLLKQNIFVNH